MKPKVLISANADNFPENVIDRFRPLAEVVRVSGDNPDQLTLPCLSAIASAMETLAQLQLAVLE